MKLSGPKETIERARNLRRKMSKPERLLWWALRRRQTGYYFRRQHPAGSYVLDFYCDEIRLCVEIDGENHDFRSATDERRDGWLARRGIVTVRIPATEVLANLEGVVQLITDRARCRQGELYFGPPPVLRTTSPCRGRS